MSNTEIADELFVSVNTVKVHLKSLYRKLGVSNRRQAAAWARDLDEPPVPRTPRHSSDHGHRVGGRRRAGAMGARPS